MKPVMPDILWSSDRSLRIVLGSEIDDATHRRVVAAWNLLRDATISGVMDVVPAYAAVQVVVDPLSVDAHAVEEQVREVVRGVDVAASAEGSETDAGRVVEIPVRYGGEFGPDLNDVAAAHGMKPRRVVELHSGAEYRVQFIGFAPGFAYLAGLPGEIHTERLATPRRRVEAGSVGIAGGQTGVYPRATAGGWRIIGRTALVMFDARRAEPSALRMGDRVRFVEVSEAEFARIDSEARSNVAAQSEPTPQPPPSGRGCRIIQPGLFSTVQDGGRFGHASVGVAPCGAADSLSLRLGNRLVGNADDAAAIEMTLMGCTVEFDSSVVVAVTGADAASVVTRRDGTMFEAVRGRAFTAAARERLKIAATRDGARSYLCVAGGIDVPLVMGSRGTHAGSGIGGIDGRALRAGDVVKIGEPRRAAMSAASSDRAAEFVKQVIGRRTLRVTTGIHAAAIPGALDALIAGEFVVSEQSDRSGIRLASVIVSGSNPPPNPLPLGGGAMITEPMLPGFIQLPPNGQPIVLGVDGPTTGGYSVIAAVVSADLCTLGQIRPREIVRFELVTVEAARAMAREQRRMLDELAPPHPPLP